MAKIKQPTKFEVERLRLILSTYQDGTGMLAQKDGTTLPGWRDFERSVAAAFNGVAQENKSIFDVLVQKPEQPKIKYGLSCKMRGELNRIETTGRVSVELSNSAGKFWDYLNGRKLNQKNYRKTPAEVGAGLLDLIGQWHTEVITTHGGVVDLDSSSYLVLSWNKAGWYQLHQFSIYLPDPHFLKWHFPSTGSGGGSASGR